jgi:hypothetical protein
MSPASTRPGKRSHVSLPALDTGEGVLGVAPKRGCRVFSLERAGAATLMGIAQSDLILA